MQSNTFRAAVATRSIMFLGNIQAFGRQRGLASATAGRTADPALHSGDYGNPAVSTGDPQGTENVAKAKPVEGEVDDDDEEQHTKHNLGCGKGAAEPLVLPNNPPPYPNVRSPVLESTAVHLQPPSDNPINYIQKRSISSHTTAAADAAGGGSLISSSSSLVLDLEKVSCCTGLDGTPWPGDHGKQTDERDKQLLEERAEDEREYYQHHKASPLSEIKFADTRKPITRAIDGTADTVSESGAGRDVIGWRPEQLDTAEEALERAARIWKENAMRGDPDAPHSRVLRALRGESLFE